MFPPWPLPSSILIQRTPRILLPSLPEPVAMAAPDPHHRTQEQSIKARKHQLFDSDEHAEFGPRRSFAECLRETPAAPISPAVKAILWVLGTLVIAILLLAFVKVGTRKPRGKPTPSSAAVGARGGRVARLGEGIDRPTWAIGRVRPPIGGEEAPQARSEPGGNPQFCLRGQARWTDRGQLPQTNPTLDLSCFPVVL